MGGMDAELDVELDDELVKMFDDLESVSCVGSQLDMSQLGLQQAPVASPEPTPQPVCPPCPSSSAGEGKECRVCLKVLPLTDFAGKNKNVCAADDTASESLQRALRKKWGNQYKVRFRALKSHNGGESYRRAIITHRMSKKNGRRTLTPTKECLHIAKQHNKSKKRRNVYKRYTRNQLVDHFQDRFHGGYDEVQSVEKANEISKSKPVDHNGVEK